MCVAVVALAVMTLAYLRRESLAAPEVRLQIVTPPGPMTDFAMSPDGQTVVFAATGGKTELWLRPLGASPRSDSRQPRALSIRSGRLTADPSGSSPIRS